MVQQVQQLTCYGMVISYDQKETGLEHYIFESENKKVGKCDIAVPFYRLVTWDYSHAQKVTLLLILWKEIITWENSTSYKSS